MENCELLLQGLSLSKQFNGNVVLNGVSIDCKKGNALALVGENGAGKSTLMNIISGSLEPDEGSILFEGKKVVFSNPHQARELGISFVHQEMSLLEELTVGENILLGMEPKVGKAFINATALHKQAESVLHEIGYKVPVEKIVSELTPAQKQMTEIAKAWAANPKLLILDEPSSSLNKAEADELFKFINQIKEKGVSIVLITHRLEEIFLCCDEVIVLKDGEMTAESKVKDITKDEIILKMVGREIKNTYPPKKTSLNEKNHLQLMFASVKDTLLHHINLEVPVGSVVGIGGLEGQGQRELARALFGINPFTSGQYLLNDVPVKIQSPKAAMKHGIAFLPDDRKLEGLALILSAEDNISMIVLDEIARNGVLERDALEKCAVEGIKTLNIKIQSHKQPVSSLSGGNQQKIVFSKWLKFKPSILILHEPTRGIDVQSKLEIYDLIRKLTETGISVLLFTSDMLELIGLSDRIYVLYEGKISGCIDGNNATEEAIMQLSAGQKSIQQEVNRSV